MNKSVRSIAEFHSLCRSCLAINNCKNNLFTGKCTNGETYSTLLMEYTSVEVSEDDGLPAYICDGCVAQLESFKRFAARCAASSDLLTELRDGLVRPDAPDAEQDDERQFINLGDMMQVEIKEEAEPRGSFPDWSTAFNLPGLNLTDLAGLGSRTPPSTPLKQFQCKTCPKTFHLRDKLETHSKVHSDLRPFACEICTMAFKRKDHLVRHMRTHSETRPYNCQYCGMKFVENYHLNRHIKNKHHIDEKIECTLCKQKFAENWKLKQHMAKHSLQEPVGCGDCGISFASDAYLAQHRRTVHQTNEKPFTCPVCEKAFNRKHNLDRHYTTTHAKITNIIVGGGIEITPVHPPMRIESDANAMDESSASAMDESGASMIDESGASMIDESGASMIDESGTSMMNESDIKVEIVEEAIQTAS